MPYQRLCHRCFGLGDIDLAHYCPAPLLLRVTRPDQAEGGDERRAAFPQS